MGNGIAQVFAQAGFAVRLVDVAQPMLDRARARRSRRASAKFVEKGKLTAGRSRRGARRGCRRRPSLDALADADYVVEAIVEDVDAEARALRQPRRARPARRHPRVEHVVDLDHGARRRDEAARPRARHALHEPGAADDARRADPRPGDVGRVDADRVASCARALGKTAVEAADYPGFIANRILMPMINEAIFAVMEGVGTPEAIDTVMKLGMNHPMGPLTLADFIGLDVCLAILDVLHEGLGDPKYRAVSAAAADGRGRTARPEVRPGLLRVRVATAPTQRSAPRIAISLRDRPRRSMQRSSPASKMSRRSVAGKTSQPR